MRISNPAELNLPANSRVSPSRAQRQTEESAAQSRSPFRAKRQPRFSLMNDVIVDDVAIGLIDGLLGCPVHTNLPERDAGTVLLFPGHLAEIDAAKQRFEIRISVPVMEKGSEHRGRAGEARELRGTGVAIGNRLVERLDTIPGDICEMLLRSGRGKICCREFYDFAVGIEIAISDPCRSDSHIGDSLPVLMTHALWINGEVNRRQTLKLRASGLISDPLVLHGDFLLPSHNNGNLRTSTQVLAFSRAAKCIEYNFEPVSDSNSD